MDNIFSLLRVIISFVVLIWLPGHLLSMTLFQGNSNINAIQRLAISNSLGIALTTTIGTILIVSNLGIHLATYLPVLLCSCLLFIWIAIRRNRTIRFEIPFHVTSFTLYRTGLFVSVFTILALVVLNLPPDGSIQKGFTEFYVLPASQDADNLYEVEAKTQDLKLKVGIRSHEEEAMAFWIDFKQKGSLVHPSEYVYVAPGETWEGNFNFEFAEATLDANHPLQIDLYRNDEVVPYRSLRLVNY